MKFIDLISRETLLSLTKEDHPACVSLFMNTVQAGPEVRQNAIRLKDLCQDAEAKLERNNVDDNVKKTILQSLHDLSQNHDFWPQKRPKAIAVFISPQESCVACFAQDQDFENKVVVDKRFYIRPLLNFTEQGKRLSVLLVNREGVKLLDCSAEDCNEEFPQEHLQSLRAFLAHHDFEESFQHQSSREAPHMHGHGAAGDEAHDNRYLEDYYHHLKNWLENKNGIDKTRPLYVVGDERNTGIFIKAASDWPGGVDVLLQRNAKSLDAKNLMENVRKKIEALAKEETENMSAELFKLKNTKPEATLQSTADIVAAAHDKRIQTLLLPSQTHNLWGVYDKKNHKTRIAEATHEAVGEELYNLAAILTLHNGGHIIVNDNFSSQTAALCRW